jgi:hypothetical protein
VVLERGPLSFEDLDEPCLEDGGDSWRENVEPFLAHRSNELFRQEVALSHSGPGSDSLDELSDAGREIFLRVAGHVMR